MKRILYHVHIDNPQVFDLLGPLFDKFKPLERNDVLTRNDAIFFDGGTDVSSEYYGERRHPQAQYPNRERDRQELEAYRRGLNEGVGFIGICRGSQFLTAMQPGGKLIQHVSGHGISGSHKVKTWDGRNLEVTSTHHQMMWPWEVPNFTLLAWSEGRAKSYCEYGKELKDGKEPEIVWYPDSRALCIQGHPEYGYATDGFVKTTHELVRKFIIERRA